MPISGALGYTKYGWETVAYGTKAGTLDKLFGQGVEITRTGKNNIFKVAGVGARNVQHLVAGKFDGSFTATFMASCSYIWKAVLGTETIGGAGPYTHTYAEADTVPSISIEIGAELGATDSLISLLGCKINSFTITAAVGELVKCTMDGFYKTETQGAVLAAAATNAEVPLVFSQGTLECPVGTTLARVQNFELTTTNNIEMLFGLGSRFATNAVEKAREYSGTINFTYDDVTKLLDKFYGLAGGPQSSVSEVATLKLTLTNGGAGTALRSWAITLTGVMLDEHALNANVNELMKENVPFTGRTLGVVGTDNTTPTP